MARPYLQHEQKPTPPNVPLLTAEDVPLLTAEDVRAFLERIAHDVLAGKVDPAQARAIANVCGVILHGLKRIQEDIERTGAPAKEISLRKIWEIILGCLDPSHVDLLRSKIREELLKEGIILSEKEHQILLGEINTDAHTPTPLAREQAQEDEREEGE